MKKIKFHFLFLFDFWLIPIIQLSISRIILPIYLFKNLKLIFKQKNLKYFIFLICCLLSLINSVDFKLFLKYLIPLVTGVFFYIISQNLNSIIFEKILKFGIILSLILNILLFSFVIILNYDLLKIFQFLNFSALRGDENVILSERFSLPFVNPARMGFFMGFSSLYFLMNPKKNLIFIILSIILLIFSGARSAMIAFIICLPFLNKYFIIPIGLTVIYIIYYIINLESSNLRILNFEQSSIYRHLILRDRTITEISKFNLKNWLFGKGIGQSEIYIFGSYSFTVPLTILFETGISGFLSFWTFFKVRKYNFIYLLYIGTAMLLYELKSEIFFWIFLGFLTREIE